MKNVVDEEFLRFFTEPAPDTAFGKSVSDSDMYVKDVHIEDHRVARFLVLLQRLDQSVGGLRTLPTPELHEIVMSAIRLSGFVDPVEARNLIATVFDAIEMKDPIPEAPWPPPAPVLGD
jgi:hypothetical protein